MSTSLTPPVSPPPPLPPSGQAPPPPTAPPPPSRSTGRVIAIIAIVLGGLLLLSTVAFGVIGSLVRAGGVSDERIVVDAAGVESLDVEASAGDVRVRFTDTDEAVLDVTAEAGAGRWSLTREGDELVVRSPQRWFFGWWFYDGPTRVVLELPQSLQGEALNAQLSLSAGSLDVEGDFGVLDLDVSAGELTLGGGAAQVAATVSAGRADLDLADVVTADLDVSAGGLKAVFTGDAPDDVTIDVSAGSLDLSVPSGAYRVDTDVSAGGVDNRLETSSSASRVITVSVSAGDVTLRSGR
ncbi:DUF4097 domain-containing protein [Microbacterium sp. zg.Y1090]|uniref:DUF4097 domain-containing protein n=1 Tax=Microbacterium wangruii TaxID=3049073 RepID=UPI00214C1FB5|nr:MULTISPECIES: DUF4097 domain-containing protein [unclassified Microbacterium]MCR2817724.1 DUF4097 domain-containing protein [Microbacterium sp. zg.Y1090]WIM28804.1 DUF4097 domain-containing protein [Microbacterium sp. zg-Y1090]